MKVNRTLGSSPTLTLTLAALLYAFSIVLIDIAPFFIGIYVDFHGLSLPQAGFVQTIDQAGGVIGAIFGFFLMPRTSWRQILVVASLIATIANAATAIADNYTFLLAVRFASGFGVVLITTVTACVLAQSLAPDRIFGAGLALAMALSAVAVWLLDWLRESFGFAASLGSGAIWLGAGILVALLLPKSLSGPTTGVGLDNSGLDSKSQQRTPAPGLIAIIALGLFGVSVNVIYGFVERIGIANGLEASGVANALALGYVFSAVGSLVPTLFGAMGGRIKWIIVTTLLFIGSLYALFSADTVALYTIAFAIYASVWNMGLAYYMALIAENDPEHKYTRAMYIVNVAAQSAGPGIAALALTGAPLSVIFLIAPAPALLALILVLLRRIGVEGHNQPGVV